MGLVLIGQASSVAVLVAAAFVAGLGHGLLFPVLSSQVVMRARTAERGSAMAIFTSIFDVALLTVAPAAGFIIDGLGYTSAYTAVGLVLASGALVYGAVDRVVGDHGVALAEGSPSPAAAPEAF